MINRGTRNIDAAVNTRCHLMRNTWEVVLKNFLKSLLPDILRSTSGRATTTAIAHSHIMMEMIRARRLVTVWYLERNLMAMKRSALIKVTWRAMTERRNKVKVPLTSLRIREGCPPLYSRLNWMISRMLGIASKPSAMDKLTRMLLEAVRSLRDLWNALRTK